MSIIIPIIASPNLLDLLAKRHPCRPLTAQLEQELASQNAAFQDISLFRNLRVVFLAARQDQLVSCEYGEQFCEALFTYKQALGQEDHVLCWIDDQAQHRVTSGMLKQLDTFVADLVTKLS